MRILCDSYVSVYPIDLFLYISLLYMNHFQHILVGLHAFSTAISKKQLFYMLSQAAILSLQQQAIQ